MTWDPYLDLEHGVLRNRLGIADAATLARVEANVASLRIAELALNPLQGRYDLALLQSMHWHIFADVYAWAGRLRSVAIGKGRPFCPPQEIPARGEAIFAGLAARDHLHGLRHREFVHGLTDLLAQLNHLHPFREGNGRTQRLMLSHIGRDAGYAIDWARLDPELNISASRAALDGDDVALREVLTDLVRPADRR